MAKKKTSAPLKVKVRKLTKYVPATKVEFYEHFMTRFYDPLFESLMPEIKKIAEVAYDGYIKYRKSPRDRAAGPGFHKPKFRLSLEWLKSSAQLKKSEKIQKSKKTPHRILIINGSSRSEHSCPGEVSKTHRLAKIACEAIEKEKGFEVDLLDLSLLTSDYGKVIYPCKACVSTAMPLCNWPCSCYPNHAMGQTGDWMAEIYPRWVAAHGVMILCPVNWYQAPSGLKLMMDRLVCADGGNPDPTLTGGKDPLRSKKLELKGWHYPKHLAGRAFSVVVHGDAAGAENLRRILTDWMTDMHMIPASRSAMIDTYIGYYQPYATSHNDLDADRDLHQQVRNAATSLTKMICQIRSGKYKPADENLENPREK